ncbi:NDP-sugar synthase [bacterium]|nr:NDP-sugar synthase [bacterium]
MKAMLFCAGLGTRMAPITKHLPKPLIEFFDRPILDYMLSFFEDWGISELVVNLHHLPTPIRQYLLDHRPDDMKLQFSEEPDVLGTGGGLKKVEAWLNGETFLVCNSDFLLDPEFDLCRIIQSHRETEADATLLLHKDPLGSYTAIQIDQNGHISALGELFGEMNSNRPRYAFCGLQLFESSVFDYLPSNKPCSLSRAWIGMREAGLTLAGHTFDGYWREIGDPKSYRQAHWEVLNGDSPLSRIVQARGDFIWIADESSDRPFHRWDIEIADNVRIIPPIALGRGCSIAKEATMGPYTVIGCGASIGPGAHVARSIIWRGASIGPNAKLIDGIAYQ